MSEMCWADYDNTAYMLNPEKCEFKRQSIQFLGLTEGVKMDPPKVTAILDWPAPVDKKGIQRFVGVRKLLSEVHQGIFSHHLPYYANGQARHPISMVPQSSKCFRDPQEAVYIHISSKAS